MADLRMQRRVSGIDVYREPQDLGSERCVQLDNLLCYAGVPKSRPGLRGLFTTPLGSSKPVWEMFPFVKADKTTQVLFAAGGATDGKLYTTTKGSATYTLVTGTPTNINTPLARIDRAGSKAYVVDSTHDIVVFDTTTGATVYVAENPPTAAPNPAILTNETLDGFTSTSGWSYDTFSGSGTNYLTNAQTDINSTADGNISGAIGTTFVAIGTSPSIHTANGSFGIPAAYANIPTASATLKWLQMDDPGDGLTTLTGASALVSPTLSAPNTDRTCCQFHYAAYYYTSDPSSQQAIKVQVKAYSDASASVLIGILTFVYTPQFAGQVSGQQFDHVFSFANLTANVKTIICTTTAADGNTNAASRPNFEGFVYVAGITLAPIDNGITFIQNTSSFTLGHTEPAIGYYGKWGGIRLTKTYGSDQDWSKKETVAIALGNAGSNIVSDLVNGGMLFRLGFRTSGAPGTHRYSNDLKFSDDFTYMYVDISTVDAATLAAFRYLEIVSLSDITVTATTNPLMKIGPLTFSGNLGIGLPYAWVFTEVKRNAGDTDWTNIIESDSSPLSVTLTPTGLQAEASLTLPTPVNGATTHYAIYRYYGVFATTDGAFPLARLIGYLPVGSDTVDPLSPGIGYLTWNHTTKVLIDDTPDSVVLPPSPTLITGKTPPPSAPVCQASWLSRLWLAKGSNIYGSWLLSASDAGLYFGPSQDPVNDPSAAIKGFYDTVGGADNDDIIALIPYGTVLLVVKERSIWIVTGTSGANFELSGHMQRAGIGIVGVRGWENVYNRAWIMTSTGPFRYDSGEDVTQMGQDIEPLIAPQVFGGVKIPGVKMQYASLLFAGRRVYLFAPSLSTSTTNDVCYVYDTRNENEGWVRWPGAFGGSTFPITGGITTAQLADDDEIFLGGYDGQIYQLTGSYDQLLPSGSQTAITASYLSRGLGQEQDDASYWADNIPSVVKASVQCVSDTTFTTTVQGSGNAVIDSHPFLVPAGTPFTMRFPDVSQSSQGDYVQVGVSASSTGTFVIRAVAIETSEGRVNG